MLRKPRARKALLVLLLGAGVAAQLYAQSYSIDWYKIAGGGGTSTGGVYAVSGTIGQHDAGGPLAGAGGNYSLTGGFWALSVLQTPGAPWLTIFYTSTNTAVVAWPAPSAGWTLQQNTNLVSGAWISSTNGVNVAGGQNQIVVSPPTGNRFYRLYHP